MGHLWIWPVAFAIASLPAVAAAQGLEGYERVTQELVAPPFLHEHEQVATGKPRVVQVRMVIEEKEMQVADDAYVQAMSFNGTVPGPMIVVHQEDYVELTLVNPTSSTMLHNIDFHASSGALGGADLTKVNSGEEVVLRFKATKPRYDRAYYIGEQDYYIPRDESGAYKRYRLPAEAMGETIEVMQGLIPTHVVFNGRVGRPTATRVRT